MIPRTFGRTAAVALLAGLTGLMGACESDAFNETNSTPLGAGSGSPSFVYRPGDRAAAPDVHDMGIGTGSPTELEAPTEPARRPMPRPTGNCNYTPNAGGDMSVAGLAFPTGDVNSSALMVHQVMPREVRRGAEFGYQYHVTNVTRGTLQNVNVTLESRSNLDVVNATPAAMSGAAGSVWSLGDLGPCETVVIDVTATANDTGLASNCISASYNNSLCATTNVVDPDLTIEKRATPRVLKCDQIQLTYNVCNPGTGVAGNVVVRDTLANGLTVNGSRSVEIPVGDLAAGECREVSVMAMASATGEYCSPATASSGDGLTANSGEPCTVVVAPDLEIACNARDTQYINRVSTYDFTVSNNGDGPSANTVVNVSLPANAEFRGNSAGGTQTANGVSFALGTLNAGESRNVSVDLVGRAVGNVRVSANATGACADPANTSCQVEYRGIPAILLEVVDIKDPVEVGTETTYRITVTNQGSADGRNILVKAMIPAEQEFVSATGPTSRTGSGREITFGTLSSLAPGAEATWTVTVRAIAEADARFAVELTSERFTTPIRETESTNLYE